MLVILIPAPGSVQRQCPVLRQPPLDTRGDQGRGGHTRKAVYPEIVVVVILVAFASKCIQTQFNGVAKRLMGAQQPAFQLAARIDCRGRAKIFRVITIRRVDRINGGILVGRDKIAGIPMGTGGGGVLARGETTICCAAISCTNRYSFEVALEDHIPTPPTASEP